MKRRQIEIHSRNSNRLDNGQALIEAVVTLTALIGLIFAIQLTGHIRTNSLDLLGESSYLSFMQSLKKFERKDSSAGKVSDQSALQKRFSEQLLYVSEEGLIRTQSVQDNGRYLRMPAYRALSPLSLSRTNYLFVNAGQSDSASEVQDRIEKSNEPWLSASRQTRVLIKSVSEPLRRIDAPWGRPRLTTDWLMPWAGQSPAIRSKGQLR